MSRKTILLKKPGLEAGGWGLGLEPDPRVQNLECFWLQPPAASPQPTRQGRVFQQNRKTRFQPQFCLLAAMLALLACGLQAQEAPLGQAKETADPWAPLRLLAGTWEGAIDGKLGQGKGVRRYEFIMNGRFLLCRHRSVRLPQEKSPQGDQHEELGVFSFDAQRKLLVYREFLNEGVVVRSPCQVEGMKVVCTSEAVESGPGIRARLTLEIKDRFRFSEKYEIAWPGQQELEHYFTNHWTRSPLPGNWD